MNYQELSQAVMARKDAEGYFRSMKAGGANLFEVIHADNPDSNNEDLFQLGLVLGYGDSFSLGNRGIVVVGDPEIGKTSLMKAFVQQDRAREIGQDDLVMTKREDEGFDLRRSPWLKGENSEQVIDRQMRYLQLTYGVKFSHLVHLRNEKGNNKFMEPDIEVISRLIIDKHTLEYDPIKIYTGVKILEYSFDIRLPGSFSKAFSDIYKELANS